MIRAVGGAARVSALRPTCPPFWKAARRQHTVESSSARHYPHRRQGCVVVCRAAPEAWRSAAPHHGSTTGGPPMWTPAAGGTPAFLQAAGYFLAAVFAFNVVRALVLTWVSWVRSQPRSRTPTPPHTQTLPPPPSPSPEPWPSAGSHSTGSDSPWQAREMLQGRAAVPSASAGAGEGPDAGVARQREVAEVAVAEARGESSASVPGAEAAGSAEEGQSVRIASYRLRPRGSMPATNLGRVVFCAALDPGPPGDGTGAETPGPAAAAAAAAPAATPGAPAAGSGGAQARPWRSAEWHTRFWEPLMRQYADGPEERVTGLLVLYDNHVLHVLEGDNNALFALLRELRAEDVGVHHLREIRVPCFVLDPRDRLFDRWHCAALPAPRRPRGLTRADLRRAVPSGAPAAGLGAAAAAAQPGLPAGVGAGLGSDAADGMGGAEQGPSPEEELVGRIQRVEAFVKLVGPKLSAQQTQEARAQALQQLRDFEPTTPAESVVAELVADEVTPSLQDFVESFDADYRRYVTLLSLLAAAEGDGDEGGGDDGGGGPRLPGGARGRELVGEVRHLSRFYARHVQRDMKDVEAQQEAERVGGSPDEVARRLARGMRLKPAPVL